MTSDADNRANNPHGFRGGTSHRRIVLSAQALAEKEQGTITWYAIKLGGPKFGIFDTFADESGRESHLNGEIAKALFGKAKEFFAKDPEVHKLDVLAAKVPGRFTSGPYRSRTRCGADFSV